ncbi:MAG: hypothetical protein HY331_15085 [Chloroflexi bacterium]|nr:hypothetical protein [Chloroflexota bacterium]
MVATTAVVLALAGAGLAGEPRSAAAELGPLYEFALVLSALHTLGVLYFVWRIFREEWYTPRR